MEEDNKEYSRRKVNSSYNYKVFRKEYNGKAIYNIPITQKQMDGTILKAYIRVMFLQGVDIPNRATIKIKKCIENFYLSSENKKNPKPIFTYFIEDFELVDNPIEEYNESKDEELDLGW